MNSILWVLSLKPAVHVAGTFHPGQPPPGALGLAAGARTCSHCQRPRNFLRFLGVRRIRRLGSHSPRQWETPDLQGWRNANRGNRNHRPLGSSEFKPRPAGALVTVGEAPGAWGPLTSAGTRASGGSRQWASWRRPLFPRTAPRTEPGAGGTQRERRPMSVAPGAFICILPRSSGGPDMCWRPADGGAQGSAGVGQVHPGRGSSDGSGASLLCNCFTASAV